MPPCPIHNPHCNPVVYIVKDMSYENCTSTIALTIPKYFSKNCAYEIAQRSCFLVCPVPTEPHRVACVTDHCIDNGIWCPEQPSFGWDPICLPGSRPHGPYFEFPNSECNLSHYNLYNHSGIGYKFGVLVVYLLLCIIGMMIISREVMKHVARSDMERKLSDILEDMSISLMSAGTMSVMLLCLSISSIMMVFGYDGIFMLIFSSILVAAE